MSKTNNLGRLFVNSLVREVGRNYGKAASNKLLKNSHATPVRGVDSFNYLGASTGGRNYRNEIFKIVNTWQVKGAVATFNVAQNLKKAFDSIVNEAELKGFDLDNINDLLDNYEIMKKELIVISNSLADLGRDDLSNKVNSFILGFSDFWSEIVEAMPSVELGERPTGLFKSKAKKAWDIDFLTNKKVSDTIYRIESL